MYITNQGLELKIDNATLNVIRSNLNVWILWLHNFVGSGRGIFRT